MGRCRARVGRQPTGPEDPDSLPVPVSVLLLPSPLDSVPVLDSETPVDVDVELDVVVSAPVEDEPPV